MQEQQSLTAIFYESLWYWFADCYNIILLQESSDLNRLRSGLSCQIHTPALNNWKRNFKFIQPDQIQLLF